MKIYHNSFFNIQPGPISRLALISNTDSMQNTRIAMWCHQQPIFECKITHNQLRYRYRSMLRRNFENIAFAHVFIAFSWILHPRLVSAALLLIEDGGSTPISLMGSYVWSHIASAVDFFSINRSSIKSELQKSIFLFLEFSIMFDRSGNDRKINLFFTNLFC